jgi:hypothetical protein
MADSRGTSQIISGMQSVGKQGSGAYAGRLDAFANDYSAGYMPMSFNNESEQDIFIKSAKDLGGSPSTANMYESHFQIANDMYDVLFAEETLEHFSKNEDTMRQWSSLVDGLNQRISNYEAIYKDSFGSNTSSPDAPTYMSNNLRRNAGGGNWRNYFNQKGLDLAVEDSYFEDILKKVDSKQHSGLSLNFDTLSWDFDFNDDAVNMFGVTMGQFLNPTDPAMASTIFAYQPQETAFKTAVEKSKDAFAVDSWKSKDIGGGESWDVWMDKMHNDYDYQNAAINFYIQSNPETMEGETVYSVRENPNTDMNLIFNAFDPEYEAQVAERSKTKTTTKTTKFTASKIEPYVDNSFMANIEVYDANSDTPSTENLMEFGVDLGDVSGVGDVKNVFFDNNGNLYVTVVGQEKMFGSMVGGVERTIQLPTGSREQGAVKSAINTKYPQNNSQFPAYTMMRRKAQG